MNLDQLTTFFGWMTIINIGLLLLTTVLVIALKNLMYKMHGKMFSLTKEQIAVVCYAYLGFFKIIVIVFNLVPYVALRLMA